MAQKKGKVSSRTKADYQREAYRRERALKKERERRKHIAILVVLCFVVAGAGFGGATFVLKKLNGAPQKTATKVETPKNETEAMTEALVPAEGQENTGEEANAAETAASAAAVADAPSDVQTVLNDAAYMAAGYDYDGAIAKLQAIPDYSGYDAVTSAIADYEQQKASCVAIDPYSVSHIFYHSLVNDPSRAFSKELLGESSANGMNAWMTTLDEFAKITQTMYERGWVLVRLRDLVVETTDENGNVHFEPNNNLMLPEGKKAYVLSVDDLSYYHSYTTASFPDKLVLDENGDVKCHYVTADGVEHVGDYDVVPWMETFLREHPDAAYKNARGLIALTGYNGVLGYRTDIDYKVREKLQQDQAAWLDAHPDFDYEQEIADATVIANRIKEEGWEFASHTWGHLNVSGKTAAEIQVDNEKWMNNCANIVGSTDTIIFAHGNDIGSWEGYSSDNEVYNYLKSAGYNFFCNVDGSTTSWVQITGDYVRQGRIDFDGYLMYQNKIGNSSVLESFFDVNEVFDSSRPTPVIANGE